MADDGLGASYTIHNSINSTFNVTALEIFNGSGGNLSGGSSDGSQLNYWLLFLLVFVVVTVIGNVLVVIAVCTTRTLHSITNYEIVSLAVADGLVGMLVMPLAVYVEVHGGKFLLPDLVCDLWALVDVLACTASILMMTAISFDRYWAVVKAVRYTQTLKNSKWYPGIPIAISWIGAVAVSSPLAFGVNSKPRREPNVCMLFNPYYKPISSVASFYIPMVTMTALYCCVIAAIRKRGRQMAATRKSQLLKQEEKFNAEATENGDKRPPERSGRAKGPEALQRSESDHLMPCESSTSSSAADAVELRTEPQMSTGSDAVARGTTSPPGVKARSKSRSFWSSGKSKRRPSEKTNGANSLLKHREKREFKVTITLAVVIAVFVMCWLPFFVINIISAICTQSPKLEGSEACDIPANLMSLFVWLGYINSTLNPILYALLNPEYRKAFIRILRCQAVTSNRRFRK